MTTDDALKRLQTTETILRKLVEAASADKLEDFSRTSNVADMAADYLRGASAEVDIDHYPLRPASFTAEATAEQRSFTTAQAECILACRNAMLKEDYAEAYNWLYVLQRTAQATTPTSRGKNSLAGRDNRVGLPRVVDQLQPLRSDHQH